MKNGYKLGLAAVAASIALVGCGGGSSSGGNSTVDTISGKFIDAAVKGLKYVTATQEGYTDENGTYNCAPGEQVTFSIGDYLELGTAECGVLASPLSITADPQVQKNMAYLLQNLDGNQSNADAIDVSNFQDFNLTDINLSESGFTMADVEARDENISDLLDPDYSEITKVDAQTNMETAVGEAEAGLEADLNTFISGNTLSYAITEMNEEMALSFESNGDFIDNDGCEGTWTQTAHDTVQVTGGCEFSLKFIGTPEDGVYVEATVTDVDPVEKFTGTVTTVGTELKAFVTGNSYLFDEQSEIGPDFWISFGANGVYEDESLSDSDTCFGSWVAIADDSIFVNGCNVTFKFPATLEDGMTITATAQDPGQAAEIFTGTLTEDLI